MQIVLQPLQNSVDGCVCHEGCVCNIYHVTFLYSRTPAFNQRCSLSFAIGVAEALSGVVATMETRTDSHLLCNVIELVCNCFHVFICCYG